MTSNPEQCSDTTDVVDSALQIGSTELTTSAESEQQIRSALKHLNESADSAEWLHEYDCWVNGKVSTSPDRALWSLLFPALEEDGLLLSTKEEKENAQNNGKPSSPKSAKSKERRNNTSKVKPTEDAFKKQGREQLASTFPKYMEGKGSPFQYQISAKLLGHLYANPDAWIDYCPKSLLTSVSKLEANEGRKKPCVGTANNAVDALVAMGVVETLNKSQRKKKWGRSTGRGRVIRLTEASRNGTWKPKAEGAEKALFTLQNPTFYPPHCQKTRKSDSVESTPVQSTSENSGGQKVEVFTLHLHPSKEGFTEKDQDRRLEASALVLAEEEKKAAANSIHPLSDLMIKIQSSQTATAMAAVLETCGTEEIGGVLNPAGQVLAPAKPKPLENHPERVSVDEKAEIQPTAPLDASEDLPDASEEELGELFGPYLPFGSKIYIKHPEFSAPSLATVCTADQLMKFQIANKSIPVDHLVVVTIAGVTKAVPCILLSSRE